MSEFWNWIKKNGTAIIKIGAFTLTAVIIIYQLPRETKFKYEFQKGSPWLHDNLIAPYNFPIYKLDSEINAEKDSLERNIQLYFTKDSLVLRRKKNELQQELQRFSPLRVDTMTDEKLDKKTLQKILSQWDENSKELTQALEKIYKVGVVAPSEVFENVNTENLSIHILQNNIAQIVDYYDLYTEKSAYSQFKAALDKILAYNDFKVIEEELATLDIVSFIRPNLFFDTKTTQKVQKEQLNNMSLTRGMIQKGEAIILKGELVNGEKYRKLESFRKEFITTSDRPANYYWLLLGQFILVLSLMNALYLFMHNFRLDLFNEIPSVLFVLSLMLIMITVANIGINLFSNSLYIIPFALVPLITKSFFDTRTALFVHLITILIIGFWAPNGFEFILLQFIAGYMAISGIQNFRRRSQLFTSAAIVFITYSVVFFAISIIYEGQIQAISWQPFMWFAINALMLLLAYPFIWAFESLFGFVSDISLIELSDSNHPLLRKLAEIAPGTFQHSMQVANLSEEAIYEIGGNPLLVRTGALYHDIGKMAAPQYFVENQAAGQNPHDQLASEQSAEIIINHVIKGIEMAQKNRIPEPIIDFIRTHHGDSKVQYFYRTFKNENPDKPVDDSKFSYPGPKPFSRETAVLMMADSVEAASRSLKEITGDSISKLVDSIINYQIAEHQFDNSPITFKNVQIIKKIFKAKLNNIYHARIEYPKEK